MLKAPDRAIWIRRGKWAAVFVVVLMILDAGRVLPVFAAPLWLSESREVSATSVHSDIAISDERAAAVADAVSRLEARDAWSGADRSTRVLLISSPSTYAVLTRLLSLNSDSQGFTIGGTVVISVSFVESMRDRWGAAYAGTILDGDLAHIVGHEMAHVAVNRRLGRRVSRRLPRWKAEGLAEYYSSDPGAAPSTPELAHRVREFTGPARPRAGAIRRQYIEASLLMSYLTSVEGWDVGQILEGPEDSTALLSRMQTWADGVR